MYKKTNLNNGLRLVTNQMNYMESAAIGIWISSGSRNENKQNSGISHFLEHMLFKGTPTRDCRRIKEEIEGRGGSLNAFTGEEVTCFLAKVSGEHLDIALGLLSDMILNASLNTYDIDRERTVIIEEIKMYQDMPNHRVHDMLCELMWPGHPLGMPIAGIADSVNTISRESLLDYKNKSYTSKNMVIAACGNLGKFDISGKVKKIFGSCVKKETAVSCDFKNKQSNPQVNILNKDTAQSHLALGMHTFGKDCKDRYVLNLLHIILGGNMSSRLFESVREQKGLAYEIGTEIKRYKETGAFVVHAGIEHKKVREAVNVILEELKKIKDAAVKEDELKRAKEFLKVQLLMSLEDTLEHMLWLGDNMVSFNKLPDKKRIIKKIEAVTSDDIKRVAGIIFKNENLNLALVGNLKENEQKEIERELEL